ncbi:MAG: flagellar export chaperone FliS [Bacillota bacterium]
MQTNPYQTYRQLQVETASPAQLVVMMYDGALKAVKQAAAALQRRDLHQANSGLLQAQRIVLALQDAVDGSAGELAAQLDSLYDYLYHNLVQANIRKDSESLEVVSGILETLRSAWLESARQPSPARPAATSAWR